MITGITALYGALKSACKRGVGKNALEHANTQYDFKARFISLNWCII